MVGLIAFLVNNRPLGEAAVDIMGQVTVIAGFAFWLWLMVRGFMGAGSETELDPEMDTNLDPKRVYSGPQITKTDSPLFGKADVQKLSVRVGLLPNADDGDC